jgi:hypothetical protein
VMGSRSTAHRAASLMVASLALPGILHGCTAPTAPPPPPGGGQTLALSFETFEQTVEPVLVAHGCDATGDCHGGGIRGSFELSPPGDKDVRFDFDQSVLQVTAADRDSSPILTEPLALASGGTAHPVKPFASTADPGYEAIRQWILAGTPTP